MRCIDVMIAGHWGFPVDIVEPIQTKVLSSKKVQWVRQNVGPPQAHIGYDYSWELLSRLKVAQDMEQSLFIDELKHSESMIDDKMNE
jgi:hypothetical protein